MLTEILVMKLERQKTLEKELNCVFIRIKPEEKKFKHLQRNKQDTQIY